MEIICKKREVLNKMGLVELAYCWTHQRREFINIKTKYQDLNGWADSWIKTIGEIYHINNERMKHKPESEQFRRNTELLRGKIKDMEKLINEKYIHPGQIEIMESMKRHWKGLTLFVDSPEIPMDNNKAERMLRKVVLGRKNFYGNHSNWACELSMAMYSVIS
ncbi:MAG: IS66 family transposase, partial [Candidatus Ratteibacteria bacterium]